MKVEVDIREKPEMHLVGIRLYPETNEEMGICKWVQKFGGEPYELKEIFNAPGSPYNLLITFTQKEDAE